MPACCSRESYCSLYFSGFIIIFVFTFLQFGLRTLDDLLNRTAIISSSVWFFVLLLLSYRSLIWSDFIVSLSNSLIVFRNSFSLSGINTIPSLYLGWFRYCQFMLISHLSLRFLNPSSSARLNVSVISCLPVRTTFYFCR